jgi:AcrR family transcriptional regulator
VTIARVAGELGVRPPSLYNHVDSREALLRAIARTGYDDLLAALTDAAVGRAGADALRALAAAYRRYAHDAPGRYLATQRALPGEPGAAAVVGVLARVLAAWGLTGDAEIHVLRAVRSALHGFVVLEQTGGFGLDVDRDASFERLVDLLVAGLGPPRP